MFGLTGSAPTVFGLGPLQASRLYFFFEAPAPAPTAFRLIRPSGPCSFSKNLHPQGFLIEFLFLSSEPEGFRLHLKWTLWKRMFMALAQ